MKRLILFIILLISWSASAQFTEWYVVTNGNNLNSGSTSATSPVYSSSTGNWNGTTTFTPTDGSTPASTVSAGMWASVYITGAAFATNTVYIAQIDTVNAGVNGTIVLSTTSKAGTAPASQTGTAELRVGGAWAGPNTNSQVFSARSVVFPLDFAVNTMTNESSGTIPRINIKAGTYSVTNGVTIANVGPTRVQGYSSSIGDGGKATLDGTFGGAGFAMVTLSANHWTFVDTIFSNNGSSASQPLVTVSGNNGCFFRCVFHDSRKDGLTAAAFAFECEAYSCNKGGSAGIGGFGSIGVMIRCTSHDNTGANSSGFSLASGNSAIGCIAWNNGRSGFLLTGNTGINVLSKCDSYSNTLHGVEIGNGAGSMWFDTVNVVRNAGNGVTNNNNNLVRNGTILNLGLGSGTGAGGMTNLLGNINTVPLGMDTNGFVLYSAGVTPWNAPDSGDFKVSLQAAKNQGRGGFTETGSGLTTTVGYPDLGAAQSTNSPSGSTATSYTFAQ